MARVRGPLSSPVPHRSLPCFPVRSGFRGKGQNNSSTQLTLPAWVGLPWKTGRALNPLEKPSVICGHQTEVIETWPWDFLSITSSYRLPIFTQTSTRLKAPITVTSFPHKWTWAPKTFQLLTFCTMGSTRPHKSVSQNRTLQPPSSDFCVLFSLPSASSPISVSCTGRSWPGECYIRNKQRPLHPSCVTCQPVSWGKTEKDGPLEVWTAAQVTTTNSEKKRQSKKIMYWYTVRELLQICVNFWTVTDVHCYNTEEKNSRNRLYLRGEEPNRGQAQTFQKPKRRWLLDW